jgi:long-subunit acyl-CoA synthetase (AMP-forming)
LVAEWTPENNLLTAAFKLKRKEIFKKYEKIIDEMY